MHARMNEEPLKLLYDDYIPDITHPDSKKPMAYSQRWRLFGEGNNAIVFYSPATSDLVSIARIKDRGYDSYPVALDTISKDYPKLSLLLMKNIDIVFEMKASLFLSPNTIITFLAMDEKDFRRYILPHTSIVDVRVYM